MEIDQPLPEPPPVKRVCFCCGRRLGDRQLTRHRTDYLAALNAELGEEVLRDDENPHVGDGEMGLGDIDMEDGEAEYHPNPEADEDPFAGFALDRDNELPALLPDPAPLHGVRRNPPVHLDDWPEPGSKHESEAEDLNEGPVDGPDQDPPYEEPNPEAHRAELNPLNEYQVGDAELRAIYDRELGDLADEEWVELYDEYMKRKDEVMLRFLATRLRTHFSRQTWDELRFGPCEALGLPSEFIAWRRLRILSGLEICEYDCCVNSCICFLGKYAELEVCPYCDEPRYNTAGHARRFFHYSPLIPQLQALFRNPDMVEKLGYRARTEADYDPDNIRDIYDGENYRSLRNTRLDPDNEYCFFDNPEDLLIVLSTDGFTLFKRRIGLASKTSSALASSPALANAKT
ncbi:hypothetical protein FS749_003974 [Ceratobasidium sp. UAMH 11750]|nr:hypothetical protein FS749_003974 [Ceratobasidium sp. UAMH 11750]